MSDKFGYSFFVVKKGQNRPSVMLFQLAASKLAETLGKPEWKLDPDGNAGPKTDAVIRSIQGHYGSTQDGLAGKNTWGAMTADLGDWRPPLRLRLAELQNTFENGNVADCFGACNVVSFEGWPNFGVWNVNWMGGDISGSSLGIILKMAGRTDLYAAAKAKDNDTIAAFFRSKDGRHVQLHNYMDKYIIEPALMWLRDSGFCNGFDVSADQLPDTLPHFNERLLALSVDIAVNSGPAGYAPKRIPRRWDGSGTFAWDDELPDRDGCRAIFSEVFGVKLPDDPAQDFSYSVDTRDTYLQALKRCLWEVCTTDNQRINLIADLQGRSIRPENNLAKMVIERRRAVARQDGYTAQGSNYCLWRNFGIGI